MKATFVKSAIDFANLPQSDRPQVALLGRSNVGKSSFVNHLAGIQGLARTSSQPGFTRTINLYDFEGKFFLADLPGYGFTHAKPSKVGDLSAIISGYLSDATTLALVLMIIDARHGFTTLDREALLELQLSGVPYVVILNKTDKLSKPEMVNTLRSIRAAHPEVRFGTHSADESAGLGEIWDIIRTAIRAAQ